MRRLLVYLQDYKKECVLAPLFKMLEASFELFIPLVIAAIIDKGIANGDRSIIYKNSGLLIILALVGLVSAVTAQFFAAKAAVGFSTSLRKDLFSHLLSLSFNEYDELGSSTMMTRMTTDVNQTQTGVNMFLRLTLRSPFVVLGAMVMAFTIDAKAAGIFLGVIVILSIVVAFIMAKNIPLLKRAQERLDRILLLVRENLTGIRVLRAFSKEESERNDFYEATDKLYSAQNIAAKVSGIMNPLTYVIINIAIVCLIYVGAIRVNNGNLTQGSVVALYNYMSQILVELIKLANMIVTLNKAIASGDRIADVFSITNSQEFDVARKGEGATGNEIAYADKRQTELNIDNDIVVEFDNVSFKYHEGGDDAISDISFSIHKGSFVGIVGGTGSGKTTLLNMIPRLYDTSNGKVKVFGQDVTNVDISMLRQNIAFTFQKASLFAGSIAENLRLSNESATDEDMIKAMHIAVADDVLKAKGGLDGQVGQAGRELSGGQRQRVTIAMAIVTGAPILIFDDSTSALDFATAKKFIENIKSIENTPTIFLASQRTNVIKNADVIIVLDDGKVVATGKHEELVRNCDVYRQIDEAQGNMSSDKKSIDDSKIDMNKANEGVTANE